MKLLLLHKVFSSVLISMACSHTYFHFVSNGKVRTIYRTYSTILHKFFLLKFIHQEAGLWTFIICAVLQNPVYLISFNEKLITMIMTNTKLNIKFYSINDKQIKLHCFRQTKSLEAYQAQVMCMKKLQQEIMQLKVMVNWL